MLPTGLSAATLLKLPGEAAPRWATFDPAWYQRTYSVACGELGDVSPTALIDFYLQVGQGQGHSPNQYFDEGWYRGEYPATIQGIQDGTYGSGFDHYCRQGHEILAPHWLFTSEQYYRDKNPDLTDEMLEAVDAANCYDHFLRWGAQACRRAHPFFDPAAYQAGLDPDAARLSVHAGPFHHFIEQIDTGHYEARTSQYFDPHWYLDRYPEVGHAIGAGTWRCALHHYLANDTPTNFDPTPEFSEAHYLRSYPDIAAGVYLGRFRNGYTHFINIGMAEGRSAKAPNKLTPNRVGVSVTGRAHNLPTDKAEAVSEGSQVDAAEPAKNSSANAVVLPDEFHGNLDMCTNARIAGWGLRNGAPAELEVLVNNRAIARIRCHSPRPDLEPHGLPINAGFEFVFDPPIASCDEVSVRFADGRELANSPSKPLVTETLGAKPTDEFSTTGTEFLDYLVGLCGLQPRDAVLDVGCGSGRTALPLSGYLDSAGRYAGFDVARKAVAWCTENISVSHPNFEFTVADIQRITYNPRGQYTQSDFSFPYPDGSFDVVLAASEFTRVLPSDIKHYMDEVFRVLKPGGRSLISFFLLNEESSALSEEGNGSIAFEHEIMKVAWAADVNNPGAAIAYPESYVKDLLRECGLELREPLHYGTWCGRTNGMSGQDVVIALKPERRESLSPSSASALHAGGPVDVVRSVGSATRA